LPLRLRRSLPDQKARTTSDVEARRFTLSEARAPTESKAVDVVTGHTSRPTHDRAGVLLFPSVRFQTADGTTVEFQNNIGTNSPPRVGDEVTVLYDPERPEDARVALASTFRINPKALLVVGAIFLGAMALFFVAVIVWVSMS
jgi:Protein of unknown function (DUF3592)